MQDLDAGRYSIASFYERRARRVLPALFVVMAVTLPLAFVTMLPAQIEDFSASIASAVLFLSNLYFLTQTGYFPPDAELQPLLAARKQVFAGATAVGAVFLVLGIVRNATDGMRQVWSATWPQKSAIMAIIETAQTKSTVQASGHCHFNIEDVDDVAASRILSCVAQHGSGVVVLGNSHAIDLFGSVVARNGHPFFVGFTKPSCRPATVDRTCPYMSFQGFVQTNPDAFTLVLFLNFGR